MKLEVTYNMSSQLIHLLTLASGHTKKEVWCQIQDLAYSCFVDIDKDQKRSLEKDMPYPGLNVYLEIRVIREGSNRFSQPDIVPGEIKGNVRVQLKSTFTSFSSKQIEEFLVENIILGGK